MKKTEKDNLLLALRKSNNQEEIEVILHDWYLRQGREFTAPNFYADKISVKKNLVIFENINYNYKTSYEL